LLISLTEARSAPDLHNHMYVAPRHELPNSIRTFQIPHPASNVPKGKSKRYELKREKLGADGWSITHISRLTRRIKALPRHIQPDCCTRALAMSAQLTTSK